MQWRLHDIDDRHTRRAEPSGDDLGGGPDIASAGGIGTHAWDPEQFDKFPQMCVLTRCEEGFPIGGTHAVVLFPSGYSRMRFVVVNVPVPRWICPIEPAMRIGVSYLA